MKRKKADIASFFRASGKKSAKAKNEDEMEKKQAESEDEEPPESSNLNGPPEQDRKVLPEEWPQWIPRFPQRRFRQRERGASNNEWRPKWTSRHFQIKN
ncbi:unnamed protein product [Pleuronectes platessa]|uniref:Uncharacterized protein n=1 Tax=Pleuronectes platessa TaxID=8262 RepID=A0A9N7W3G9_PLEPL|nr:unnamed protein product [Pleuronectes platessa]